jgi:predicted HD phosphohydrolase
MIQGGIYTEEEVAEAQKDPWLESKLAVRSWDDQAKDPSMQTPPLEHFEEMMVSSLLKSRAI